MTTLFTNPLGIVFERTDYKNRSKVKVHNNGYNLRTYRFNNVECFESPYISWENLDQCGGWATKDDYLKTAVQNRTKLFAQIIHKEDEQFEITNDVTIDTKPHAWSKGYYVTHISRKGCLADYYDIEAVVEQYSLLGIELSESEVDAIYDLVYEPIWMFATDEAPFNYANPVTDAEWIVNGLLLGYPLESTASILMGY